MNRNKNKKCQRVINKFLQQENPHRFSPAIGLHMLICKSCRKEIKELKNILMRGQSLSPFTIKRDISSLVMSDILNMPDKYRVLVPLWQWLFPGLIIFTGIVAISYSDTMIWLKKIFGSSLEIPISIVLGMVISIYTVVAVFSFLGRIKNFSLHHHNK